MLSILVLKLCEMNTHVWFSTLYCRSGGDDRIAVMVGGHWRLQQSTTGTIQVERIHASVAASSAVPQKLFEEKQLDLRIEAIRLQPPPHAISNYDTGILANQSADDFNILDGSSCLTGTRSIAEIEDNFYSQSLIEMVKVGLTQCTHNFLILSMHACCSLSIFCSLVS